MRATVSDWTTVADLRKAMRRRWSDGMLLAAYAGGHAFPSQSLPIRGPHVRDIGARLEDVRRWRDGLVRGSAGGAAYELVERDVGGRVAGRNSLPSRALLSTYDQTWRLLGVTSEVAAFDELLEHTQHEAPELVHWVVAHPIRALRAAEWWVPSLAAYRWLRTQAASGAWLREISAPGVDTKFVEQHHGLLAELLIASDVEPAPVEGSPSAVGAFAQRFRLRVPERLVQVRFHAEFAGMPKGLSEGGFRLGELASLGIAVGTVVIVENLQTYLAWPVPYEGLVIWGAGYVVPRLSRVQWVRDATRVVYSGDLDTHGLAILSGLRTGIRRVESLAMDRETLLAHRDRWVTEPTPTVARLPHLTPSETELYRDLVEDAYGPRIRLEQERLDWTYVEKLIEVAQL